MKSQIKINEETYITFKEHEKIIAELIKEGKIKEVITEIKENSVKRFSSGYDATLTRLFNNLFTSPEKSMNEDLANSKGVIICDPATILMCIGKSEEGKRFLAKYKDFEDPKKETLEKLDYTGKSEVNCSRFNPEYLKKILEILEYISQEVKIHLLKDYPIKLENEHFAFVLAPRIKPMQEEENYENF